MFWGRGLAIGFFHEARFFAVAGKAAGVKANIGGGKDALGHSAAFRAGHGVSGFSEGTPSIKFTAVVTAKFVEWHSVDLQDFDLGDWAG